jgi:hypothetical protein
MARQGFRIRYNLNNGRQALRKFFAERQPDLPISQFYLFNDES